MPRVGIGRGTVALLLCAGCGGSNGDAFVRTRAGIVALTHVRVIDGTAASGKDDQTVIIQDGKIGAMGDSSRTTVPAAANVFDLHGRTVIPGLVGMHDHLFYQIQRPSRPADVFVAPASFAKLYLASGVTTIRTAGTFDFNEDLRMKRLIDRGQEPGPKIHVTSPYLNASDGDPNPGLIVRDVNEWADQGATSFKAYTTLRLSELHAAINAAHARGLKITGHLCAVGFQDAAALGIDNVEHGLLVDTEFYSGKRPDECPDQNVVFSELLRMDVAGVRIQQTIGALVRHRVALTSTLAVFESLAPRDSAIDQRIPAFLAPRLRNTYRAVHDLKTNPASPGAEAYAQLLQKEMQFERQFVAADGHLMAGVDPTGWGGVVAGSGDQRELELLVEEGLTPEQAIKVATANGAAFLGEQNTIRTVTVGKQADLVVVRRDPSAHISDVRNVELVFKDGVAYDPVMLIAAVEGTVGQVDIGRLLRSRPGQITAALTVLLVARIIWRRRFAKVS